MAKAKQTAFVLDEKRHDEIPSDDAVHFGMIPGQWLKGVPVLLADLDPDLDEADFRRMVKEADAPIVAVKVDSDYKPRRGRSQIEIRQKGGTPHLPAGRPLLEGQEADVEGYREMPKDALETVAESRGVEDAPELSKPELVEEIGEQDEGGKK